MFTCSPQDKVVLQTQLRFLPKVVSIFHNSQAIELSTFFLNPHAGQKRTPFTQCQRTIAVLFRHHQDFLQDKAVICFLWTHVPWEAYL